jgi:hypothetical protein
LAGAVGCVARAQSAGHRSRRPWRQARTTLRTNRRIDWVPSWDFDCPRSSSTRCTRARCAARPSGRHECDGHYEVEAERRNLKGPGAFDAADYPCMLTIRPSKRGAIPSKGTIRRSLVISNEVTVFDHALTRPWIVTRHYRRSADPHLWWVEDNCMETTIISVSWESHRRDAHADKERVSGLLIFDISLSCRKSDN